MCGVVAISLNKDFYSKKISEIEQSDYENDYKSDNNNHSMSFNLSHKLMDGMRNLEYRGYDSAGITVSSYNSFDIETIKVAGGCDKLKEMLDKVSSKNNSLLNENNKLVAGIGHTRWATHGKPSDVNAHPHYTENISIVHNGIIENYLDLKEELRLKGYDFKSDTDTEVIAKLLDYYYITHKDPLISSNLTLSRLKGSYSLVFLFKKHKGLLIGAKYKTSLIIGLSENSCYLASDVLAFDESVKKVIYLEDNDRVILNSEYFIESITDENQRKKIFEDEKYLEVNNYLIYNGGDNNSTTPLSNYSFEYFLRNNVNNLRKIHKFIKSGSTDKKDFEHYMLKEIHEQPQVIRGIIDSYNKGKYIEKLGIDWSQIKYVKIIGCGSAYLAGYVAKYWFEEYSDITVDVEIASEYRYRKSNIPVNNIAKEALCIAISQSGETLDTLEAVKKAKSLYGIRVLSLVNTDNSAIERASDFTLNTMAGPEIGVVSTKAFIAQIISLSLIVKEICFDNKVKGRFIQSLIAVPNMIQKIILDNEKIKKLARNIKNYKNILFIGRNILYPTSIEGALKLKEISYIHAESYGGGELKHGPISLIDKDMMVIALIHDDLYDKSFANIQEVHSRDGVIVSIASLSDANKVNNLKNISDFIIEIEKHDSIISPIVYTVVMQFISYYSALYLDKDIDRPRNLAKSVTVE
ncbi:MAG TPA: glutamine--fructose-6-phosphate aminotransferase [Candidatus Megaira endosymbiont of Hartmannula sinica]|nr:glutamine--fructose-6-phosphate aminotransferase [Candidatus Megaera endosymbiont of Hartmannula sinica]